MLWKRNFSKKQAKHGQSETKQSRIALRGRERDSICWNNDLSVGVVGIIVGIIIFQTSIIAPTVFKTVNSKETSSFLRIVFPKFFILILDWFI